MSLDVSSQQHETSDSDSSSSTDEELDVEGNGSISIINCNFKNQASEIYCSHEAALVLASVITLIIM